MNKHQHHHHLFEDMHIEDYSVLNFLLEHIRGLSPSSLTPALAVVDDEMSLEDMVV